MAVLNAVSIAEIKARGSIKDADVLKVRRNYYDDGIITPEEADAIFALNVVRKPASAEVETFNYPARERLDRTAPAKHRFEQMVPLTEADVTACHMKMDAE